MHGAVRGGTVDDIQVESVVEAAVAMYQQHEQVGQVNTRCVSA